MSTTTPLTISQLQARCAEMSSGNGFHDARPDEDHPLMTLYRLGRIGGLLTTEHGELLEEIRGGHPMTQNYYPLETPPEGQDVHYRAPGTGGRGKPEGVPAEAADILIRLLDWCGEEGIDLEAAVIEKMAFNASRPRMHGGKKA